MTPTYRIFTVLLLSVSFWGYGYQSVQRGQDVNVELETYERFLEHWKQASPSAELAKALDATELLLKEARGEAGSLAEHGEAASPQDRRRLEARMADVRREMSALRKREAE